MALPDECTEKPLAEPVVGRQLNADGDGDGCGRLLG
jgi:hypothetical protein